ncbi:integrase core domain-containing protein [Glutamicibacter soli]|uniref:integrase core domain-containing protein n=1 Tax=Glutamicibacter soli TaxID=453836 RepID=UPI003C768E43
MKNALESHGVQLSHNRPYVSNDNPFSKSGFRTMKYRPGYPKVFAILEDARTYLAEYVLWYNRQHKYSGIALVSPAHFHRQPVAPAPAGIVGINVPSEDAGAALQAA